MKVARLALHTIALLVGAYSALTWSVGLLTHAGVAGAISAAAFLAGEAIWYCQLGHRDRSRNVADAVWTLRIARPPDVIRVDRSAECFTNTPVAGLTLPPECEALRDRLPVWPNSSGAPE